MTGIDLARYRTRRIARPTAGELADMIRAGETVEQLAATFGCSASSIRQDLLVSGHGQRDRRLAPAEPDPPPPPLVVPGAWVQDALCAQTDPEIFYPEKGGSSKEAKAVCRRCPVQAECLDYALESGERFGIWGGTSERERRRLVGLPDEPADDDTCEEEVA